MTTLIPPNPFVSEFLAALGLDNQKVTELTLRMAVEEPVTMTVTQFVDSTSLGRWNKVTSRYHVTLDPVTTEKDEAK